VRPKEPGICEKLLEANLTIFRKWSTNDKKKKTEKEFLLTMYRFPLHNSGWYKDLKRKELLLNNFQRDFKRHEVGQIK